MRKVKSIWCLSAVMMVAAMSLLTVSCSKDEVVPELKIPTGSENYFAKSMDFDSPSAEKKLTFTSNVKWTATVSGSSWLSVTPTSGEAGTNTLTVKAEENTTYDDRNTVITIAAGDTIRRVFVNQKQLDALTLTSDRFEVPVEGGEVKIEVKANVNFEAVVPTEYQSWIHKSVSATRGLTTSTLVYKIDKSEEYDKREGKIIIKGNGKEETVTVYQTGGGILTLTQNDFNISSSAQELSIEISSNFDYDVTMPDVDWISNAAAQTRGVSTHTLKLAIAENTGYDARSAKVTFYDKNSALSEEVTITQSQKNALIIDNKEYKFDEKGGSIDVDVNSNVKYAISINCDWITEKKAATTRGLEKTTHTFVISEMTDNSERVGTITFSDEETGIVDSVKVTQTRAIYFERNNIVLVSGSEKSISIINNTDQTIAWSSSDNSIVTVDNNGNLKAIGIGSAIITATTADGLHSCDCSVDVRDITDCVSLTRVGTGFTSSSAGMSYQVTFLISNHSSETIHIVSLGGVTEGVEQDIDGGGYVRITLSSPTAIIQTFLVELIYTYNGVQYSLAG